MFSLLHSRLRGGGGAPGPSSTYKLHLTNLGLAPGDKTTRQKFNQAITLFIKKVVGGVSTFTIDTPVPQHGNNVGLKGTLQCRLPTPQQVDQVFQQNVQKFQSPVNNAKHKVTVAVSAGKKKRDDPPARDVAAFAEGTASTLKRSNAVIRLEAARTVEAAAMDPELQSTLAAKLTVAQGTANAAFKGIANNARVLAGTHAEAVTASAQLRLLSAAAVSTAAAADPGLFKDGPRIPALIALDPHPPGPALAKDASARQTYASLRLSPGVPCPDWPPNLPTDTILIHCLTLLASSTDVMKAGLFVRNQIPNIAGNQLTLMEQLDFTNADQVSMALGYFKLTNGQLRQAFPLPVLQNFSNLFKISARPWTQCSRREKEEWGLVQMLKSLQNSITIINGKLKRRNTGLCNFKLKLGEFAACSEILELKDSCSSVGAVSEREELCLQPWRLECLPRNSSVPKEVEQARKLRNLGLFLEHRGEQTPDPDGHFPLAAAKLLPPPTAQGYCSQNGCNGMIAGNRSFPVDTNKRILVVPRTGNDPAYEDFHPPMQWNPLREGLGQLGAFESKLWKAGEVRGRKYELKSAVLRERVSDGNGGKKEVYVSLLRPDEAKHFTAVSSAHTGQATRLSLQQTGQKLRQGDYTCTAALYSLRDEREEEEEEEEVIPVHGQAWWNGVDKLGRLDGMSADALLIFCRAGTAQDPTASALLKIKDATSPLCWKEMDSLRALRDVKGVVQLVPGPDDEGFFLLQPDCQRTFLGLRLERMDGNMEEYVTTNQALSSRELRCVGRQVVSALLEMEQRGFRHGDIKPQNLLYRNLRGQEGWCQGQCGNEFRPCGCSLLVKVGDMEYAAGPDSRTGEVNVGTWPDFLGPELRSVPGPGAVVNVAALDSFALGISLARLYLHPMRVLGRLPLNDPRLRDDPAARMLGSIVVCELLDGLLKPTVRERLSMEDAQFSDALSLPFQGPNESPV